MCRRSGVLHELSSASLSFIAQLAQKVHSPEMIRARPPDHHLVYDPVTLLKHTTRTMDLGNPTQDHEKAPSNQQLPWMSAAYLLHSTTSENVTVPNAVVMLPNMQGARACPCVAAVADVFSACLDHTLAQCSLKRGDVHYLVVHSVDPFLSSYLPALLATFPDAKAVCIKAVADVLTNEANFNEACRVAESAGCEDAVEGLGFASPLGAFPAVPTDRVLVAGQKGVKSLPIMPSDRELTVAVVPSTQGRTAADALAAQLCLRDTVCQAVFAGSALGVWWPWIPVAQRTRGLPLFQTEAVLPQVSLFHRRMTSASSQAPTLSVEAFLDGAVKLCQDVLLERVFTSRFGSLEDAIKARDQATRMGKDLTALIERAATSVKQCNSTDGLLPRLTTRIAEVALKGGIMGLDPPTPPKPQPPAKSGQKSTPTPNDDFSERCLAMLTEAEAAPLAKALAASVVERAQLN